MNIIHIIILKNKVPQYDEIGHHWFHHKYLQNKKFNRWNDSKNSQWTLHNQIKQEKILLKHDYYYNEYIANKYIL